MQLIARGVAALSNTAAWKLYPSVRINWRRNPPPPLLSRFSRFQNPLWAFIMPIRYLLQILSLPKAAACDTFFTFLESSPSFAELRLNLRLQVSIAAHRQSCLYRCLPPIMSLSLPTANHRPRCRYSFADDVLGAENEGSARRFRFAVFALLHCLEHGVQITNRMCWITMNCLI